MSKHFRNVTSYKNLKEQYKKLLKANHPDNGGDLEAMKEINVEYDALFKIWKDRAEVSDDLTEEEKTETASSTRSAFYTAFGWEGHNHDWSRSLKEVAQIVRAYVKEKFPTYKFSVRTSYASMCQELHVELKESPIEIYKTVEELTNEDKIVFLRKANRNNVWKLDSWNDAEFIAEYNRITAEHSNFYKALNEATQTVVDDVDAFVKSYNFEDCDGMIDYFDVDFYYFGCCQNNGINIKIVPKTARIKNKSTKPATKKKTVEKTAPEPVAITEKPVYTYKITQGEDTRDGSALWIVRIAENLSRDEYIAENKTMKERGGYYSKFKHGFIFRFDPAEILSGGNVA